jgi:opacity protein-like surface antigen
MRKIQASLMILSVWVMSLAPVGVDAGEVHSQKGPLGVGVRAGLAVLTQDIEGDIKSGRDALVGAQIFYGMGEADFSGATHEMVDFFFLGAGRRTYPVRVGLDVNWEDHKFKDRVTGSTFGTARTITLLPYTELHVKSEGSSFSPYVLFGLGLNLNSFSESAELASRCAASGAGPCSLSPRTSVAVKIGAGADYPLSPNWAFNSEAGWKFNSASVDAEGLANPEIDRFRTSHFSLLVGLRYLFF